MKRLLLTLLGLPPLALVGVVGAAVHTRSQLGERYPTGVTAPDPRLGDVERGRHLMVVAKCGVCHGADLGGGTLMDEPLLGSIHGPNLTSGTGGVGRLRTDDELALALRRGVDPEGRPLLAMPTVEHARLSEAELASILLALRALPPVDRVLPPSTVGPGLATLYALGQIELLGAEQVDPTVPPPPDPGTEPTAALGEHLAHIGSCFSCHGDDLAGGPMAGAPPDFPPASNLTPDPSGLGGWSERDLVRALREGVRPDGSTIDPRMPWAYTAAMTDGELHALYLYLRTVPPRPTDEG